MRVSSSRSRPLRSAPFAQVRHLALSRASWPLSLAACDGNDSAARRRPDDLHAIPVAPLPVASPRRVADAPRAARRSRRRPAAPPIGDVRERVGDAARGHAAVHRSARHHPSHDRREGAARGRRHAPVHRPRVSAVRRRGTCSTSSAGTSSSTRRTTSRSRGGSWWSRARSAAASSAVAPYDTNGFRSPDWVGFQYDSADTARRRYSGPARDGGREPRTTSFAGVRGSRFRGYLTKSVGVWPAHRRYRRRAVGMGIYQSSGRTRNPLGVVSVVVGIVGAAASIILWAYQYDPDRSARSVGRVEAGARPRVRGRTGAVRRGLRGVRGHLGDRGVDGWEPARDPPSSPSSSASIALSYPVLSWFKVFTRPLLRHNLP